MSFNKEFYNISLRNFNSFHLDIPCERFIPIESERDLKSFIQQNSAYFILGGGSNVLFGREIDEPVLKNNILGIAITKHEEEYVLVEVGGGEVWHDLVIWALAHDFGGIENLALIPGSVGAAPVQNIGAYGVELSQVLDSIRYIDMTDGSSHILDNDQCLFAYRNSIFKNELKDLAFITRVTLRLTTKNHMLNTQYGDIEQYLATNEVDIPTIRNIADAVIAIRSSKLPDPDVIGNAGSFFKNPVVSMVDLKELMKNWPDIKYFPQSDNLAKIPAAWLIEQCGLKGYRKGDAGIYDKHALIIVNHGEARFEELVALVTLVKKTVAERFGIELETEVNLIV